MPFYSDLKGTEKVRHYPSTAPERPLVSVCVQTYMHEEYIQQCLDGILMQATNFDFEVLVGEDDSSDNTRQICIAYADKYPHKLRLFLHDRSNVIYVDGSPTGRYNFMYNLKKARGKYIAICEGDDYWTDANKLQRQVDYLEADSELGLVHCDVTCRFVDTGAVIPAFNKARGLNLEHSNIVMDLIEFKYGVRTCTAVIRKEILYELYETCPYEFGGNFLMSDTQMWLELAHRSKVKYIDEPMAVYNYLPESVSRSKDINKHIKFLRNSRDMHLHYADKYGGNEAERLKEEIIKRTSSNLLNIAYQNRRHDLAIETMRYSMKHKVFLGLRAYLHLIGSRNIAISYLVRMLFSAFGVGRKFLQALNLFRANIVRKLALH